MDDSSSRHEAYRQLTSRQTHCAELVAKGLTSKEIARQLDIAPSTVDTHISAVLARYNLRKRSDLSLLFTKEHQRENPDELACILPESDTGKTFTGPSVYIKKALPFLHENFLVLHLPKLYIFMFLIAVICLSLTISGLSP